MQAMRNRKQRKISPLPEFSQEFYRQWISGGKPLADAVQAAMLHVREKASGDIYDWAPFVLVGSGATQVA